MSEPIHAPAIEQVPEYFRQYLNQIEEADLLLALRAESIRLRDLLREFNEERAGFRYADGKWSVREILGHILDSERVFCYRALCIARGERVSLPGFDENAYVAQSRSDGRSLASLVEELENVRAATANLFVSLDGDVLDRTGTANGQPTTPRILGFIIAGHAAHHRRVLKERYLEEWT
jgi:hypothetical protein